MMRKFLLVSGACSLLVVGCGSFDGQSDNHGNDVEPTNQLGDTSVEPVEEDVETKPEAPKPEQIETTKPDEDADLPGQTPKPEDIVDDDLLGEEQWEDDAIVGEETASKPEDGTPVKPEEDDLIAEDQVLPGQTDEPAQDELAQDELAQDELAQDELAQEDTTQQEHLEEPSQDDGDTIQDADQVGQSNPLNSGLLDRVDATEQHLEEVRSALSEMSFDELHDLIVSRVDAMERFAEASFDQADMENLRATSGELRSFLEGLKAESIENQEEGAAKVMAAVEKIEIYVSERQ